MTLMIDNRQQVEISGNFLFLYSSRFVGRLVD